MNFAVLASGHGSNLGAIINAVKSKKIKANLAVVISDKADAFALARARRAGIASFYINPKDYADRAAFDKAVVAQLKAKRIGFVVLAGYMRLLSPYFIKQYKNRILNIHPALLPSFKGVKGIQDAFDYGVKVTGATVHFVTDEMDAGPIIMQGVVAVDAKDSVESLAEKIHRVEHKIYPQAIDLMARGKLRVVGRKVRVSF